MYVYVYNITIPKNRRYKHNYHTDYIKNKLNFIYLVTRVHLMGGPLLKPLALFAQVDIVCCLRSWTTVDTCRYS